MEDLSAKGLDTAIVDVRRAYRLFFAYQTRILQLMQLVEHHSDWEFKGGYQCYSDRLKHPTKISLTNWAWDWLPMKLFAFYFELKREDSDIPYKLEIYHQADTGWDDTPNSTFHDKNKLHCYKEVEHSKTRLIFVFCHKHDPGLHHQVESKTEPSKFKSCKSEWLEPSIREDEPFSMIAKAYPLSDFTSEESLVIKMLEFEEFCQTEWDKQISFTIKS